MCYRRLELRRERRSAGEASVNRAGVTGTVDRPSRGAASPTDSLTAGRPTAEGGSYGAAEPVGGDVVDAPVGGEAVAEPIVDDVVVEPVGDDEPK